ncbi:formate dehydrogenase subunit alpha [Candidatus Methylopumilus universalis]|jgi:formate dehydrogenase major subunit|uniref:formate dehydrogenase subunit alpha n=1 Tax=Candidatus Methylopumilus TaxID=1679002 RepID=UPI00111DA0DB|nr:formate dehydrogenase subunit alpha [Candidatus Methylopumilus universalis]QDC46486.1 formate dehydrogenase subunit alpha [Candidatus Methylopumilus universalis]QDC80621.1 formate dehydrogenase subunit alpha [Candidatus Methylopumilus universalis]QDC81930.1 formate dehydrogenase subunit alpha [Candidatus Methylopumilus universalis]QDC88365.1 formate dehydrogenase subunit alpha [Candidatus Methylopumilus universalis]
MDDVKDFGTPKRISDKTVNLTIDGVSVSVPEGTSVMHAASLSGVTVPKLCATDSLEPFGSCRLCLVEIEGRRGYPASCTTPVAEGIKVHTQTPKLADIRRGVMELYISDHPLDCLTCATNGDCELQDMAGAVGLRDVRYGYEGENHLKSVKDTSNPYFTFDPSKCIVCSRCVRACEEVQGTFALTIQGRGFDSKVSAGNKDFKDSECVSCGACVQACPTATLIENTIIEAGVPEHSVTTTCAYCGVGCSFHAEMKGEEVVRMTPNKDGGANHGHSCVKGRFAWGYATHKDRITTPMIRKSIHDPWEKVTWDVAINYAASEIQRIQKKYGRDSVGAISSSRCTNEEVYVVQKLVRAALGNNNVDTCARVCHSPTGYGLKQTLGESAGTQNFDSVMHSDVIMIIGANPTDGHPVFASQMKRRLREGAKLIIVDPRAIDLVDNSPHIKADYHLKLKPGSNVAIVNALAHVIVTEKLMDDSFIKARCEDDAFKSWKDFITKPENSPEAMSAFTGVDAKDVRAAAKLFAKGGNAAIYYGLGVTEHSQGSTMVMGIANLAMLTGNIGREGVGVNPLRGQNNVQGACDMGSFPHEFPGYRHVSDKATLALFEKAWDVKLQNEPGLRIPNMLDVAIDGQFKALYCEGEDIAQSDPNTQHVTHALESMECVIVQDLFLNETAMYAHVFLPGSSFLEKNGTFTNAERRISRVRKVMSPKNGYEDWEITQMLSNALGYKMDYSHASDIMDEIARLTPTFKGVSYKKLDELGSIQWPCNDEHPLGTPTMHIDEFVRGKGKFIITEYVPTSEKVTQKYPLILTTGRILSQYNVGAQTRRTKNVAWHEEDLVEIHPHDAEERGIQSGDWVGIVSRSGETVLRAQITERVQPGVIYTTFHHPESGANVITTDNSDWATNCPEFKVTAVQVNKVTQLSDWQKQYQHFSEEQIEFAGKSKELKIH